VLWLGIFWRPRQWRPRQWRPRQSVAPPAVWRPRQMAPPAGLEPALRKIVVLKQRLALARSLLL
jgi:hypothetical protein